MIQLMSFDEWEAAQDPEHVFEWGSTTKELDAALQHFKKPFKEIPESTKQFFYSNYVHKTVGEQNEQINSSKPKDSE